MSRVAAATAGVLLLAVTGGVIVWRYQAAAGQAQRAEIAERLQQLAAQPDGTQERKGRERARGAGIAAGDRAWEVAGGSLRAAEGSG